jgi:LPXTG-site transpeptidase (sortase) family protein
MKIHLWWSRPGPRAWEVFFLLFGLTALDVYIWANTATILYQGYENWSFEQRLSGKQCSFSEFASAEIRALLSREQIKTVMNPEVASPEAESPRGPMETKPPTPLELIGRLEIPNLHLTAVVREGADSATLRRAVGHIPGTAMPGGNGNIGLAGHRDTFFRALRNIEQGDIIELQTESRAYRYVVESYGVVQPQDIHVLDSSNEPILTLVTCYPFYYVGSAPERFIVRAGLVSTVPLTRTGGD